jgi:uroporphyrinogen decarboxylase
MRRYAATGARLIWIEDCMSDMISPAQFRDFALPYLRGITEAAREAGLYTVHYFCGRPNDRWDLLLDSGADALSLEESKKTFLIDIMEVAGIVQGRMALLGNIDAIGIVEQGSDATLQGEVLRQCEAGRRNGNRFLVSLGSPVTPDTPLRRVRQYCDMVHGAAECGCRTHRAP